VSVDKETLINLIQDKGIVGAGGAGFPTFFKFKTATKAEHYIINAAECEPLLFNDQWLMENHASEIVEGIEIGRQILGVKEAVIGIKNKYHKAIENLSSAIKAKNYPIRIFEMDNFYPAGDEQIMLFEILGKTVPAGGIPIQIGAVVNNVNTAYNVYQAVNAGNPVISRLLTVNGVGISNPVVMEVPLGVEVEFLLQNYFPLAWEKLQQNEAELIIGGPMMGKIWDRKTRETITKTTGGLLVLPVDSPSVRERKQTLSNIIRESRIACCNCSYCTELCTRMAIGHNFKTHLIMQGIAYADSQFYVDYDAAWMCSECGVCSMVSCPMGLSPRRVNQFIKSQYRKEGKKPSFPDKVKEPVLEGRKVPYYRLLNRLGLKDFEKDFIYREFDKYPDFLFLTLQQHIGKKGRVIVKEGEAVEKGQLLMEPVTRDDLCVALHSPFKGRITAVESGFIKIEV
jgi:Na+-translocating ferredoxin:NAD+ oxidoreductase RnfC subunit